MTTLEIQRALIARGYAVAIDGEMGEKTKTALRAFQKASGLSPDGMVGPKTLAALSSPTAAPVQSEGASKASPSSAVNLKFDPGSAKRLGGAHPLIQQLMNEARDLIAFTVMDSQRGRAAQEKAFREGHSKAHFGQSAHNWSPSIAVDIAPIPLDWNDRKAFIALSKIILPIARARSIPIRWGGDWNMNGILTDERLSDLPHYELHKWQDFAKRDCKPFGE